MEAESIINSRAALRSVLDQNSVGGRHIPVVCWQIDKGNSRYDPLRRDIVLWKETDRLKTYYEDLPNHPSQGFIEPPIMEDSPQTDFDADLTENEGLSANFES
ncbi:hypothetical protein NPIL_380261 [Nephila pilipes]|uniref:Uncharacterized protein n=1 Tax=Nephila pilipes TaxID=299642 RepID=A0A8X6QQE5_NEPPI|nr:hypothetical protein NPIL_380261 [Nephila pilipes]